MKGKAPFYHLMHIGLVVKDLDQAMKDLAVYGIGPFKNPADMTGPVIFRGKESHASVRGMSTMLGDVDLEVAQPIEGETSQQEYMDSQGEGLHHVGFAVNDLKKDTAYLTNKGYEIMLSGTAVGEKFNYFDLKAEGLILQLTEFEKKE